jgi:molybdopterin molybdotransferase
VAPDDPERICTMLEPWLARSDADGGTPPCDLVLTLGGTHRGDFDYVHTVLERLGAGLSFDRIRMTPGSSTIFARHGATLCFGLPGTPMASWAAFEALVRPALWRLAGRRQLEHPRLTARLAEPLPHEHGSTAFVACRVRWVGGEPEVAPIQGRHPHEPPASARADGLIRCPEGQRLPAVGDWVRVEWLAD